MIDGNCDVGHGGGGSLQAHEYPAGASPMGTAFPGPATWQGPRMLQLADSWFRAAANTFIGGEAANANGHRLDYFPVERRRLADVQEMVVDRELEALLRYNTDFPDHEPLPLTLGVPAWPRGPAKAAADTVPTYIQRSLNTVLAHPECRALAHQDFDSYVSDHLPPPSRPRSVACGASLACPHFALPKLGDGALPEIWCPSSAADV